MKPLIRLRLCLQFIVGLLATSIIMITIQPLAYILFGWSVFDTALAEWTEDALRELDDLN